MEGLFGVMLGTLAWQANSLVYWSVYNSHAQERLSLSSNSVWILQQMTVVSVSILWQRQNEVSLSGTGQYDSGWFTQPFSGSSVANAATIIHARESNWPTMPDLLEAKRVYKVYNSGIFNLNISLARYTLKYDKWNWKN